MIAITGVTGHLGNTVCQALDKAGYRWRGLTRNSDKAQRMGFNHEVIQGDLMVDSDLDRLLNGTSCLIHLAAEVSIYPKDREKVLKTNIEGPKQVIKACVRNHVETVIHFSSIHAHESSDLNHQLDEKTPYEKAKVLAYNYSKSTGEQLMIEARKKGINVVIINPTSVLGPNDYQSSYSGQMLRDLYSGKLNTLVKGGFDWVDVRDIAEAVVEILKRKITNEKYILSGRYASIKDLAKLVANYKGTSFNGVVLPLWTARWGLPFISIWSKIRSQDPLYTKASLAAIASGSKFISNQKAQKELNYEARPLKNTIYDTLDWFKANSII